MNRAPGWDDVMASVCKAPSNYFSTQNAWKINI